jgi:uncharacterized protein YndB with AHSA1/START domain
MPVISSTKSPEDLTLTIVAEFAADPERVWQLWSDPRQLERWWGPPTWPATFTQHDFVVGGMTAYHMTGPAGEKAPGWWRFVVIEEPSRLEFEDGFADEKGEPDTSMGPAGILVRIEDAAERSTMTIVSSFESIEVMDKMIDMGMEEGMKLALGQADAILADPILAELV